MFSAPINKATICNVRNDQKENGWGSLGEEGGEREERKHSRRLRGWSTASFFFHYSINKLKKNHRLCASASHESLIKEKVRVWMDVCVRGCAYYVCPCECMQISAQSNKRISLISRARGKQKSKLHVIETMKPNGDGSVAKKEWRENEVKDAAEYTMSGSLSFSAIKTKKEKEMEWFQTEWKWDNSWREAQIAYVRSEIQRLHRAI